MPCHKHPIVADGRPQVLNCQIFFRVNPSEILSGVSFTLVDQDWIDESMNMPPRMGRWKNGGFEKKNTRQTKTGGFFNNK